jgi:hypothetical protein
MKLKTRKKSCIGKKERGKVNSIQSLKTVKFHTTYPALVHRFRYLQCISNDLEDPFSK